MADFENIQSNVLAMVFLLFCVVSTNPVERTNFPVSKLVRQTPDPVVHKVDVRTLWFNGRTWCVTMVTGRNVCSRQVTLSARTKCGSRNNGDIWTEANGTGCVCDKAGKICSMSNPLIIESSEKVGGDFYTLCSERSTWFDGIRWCHCVPNWSERDSQFTAFCTQKSTEISPYSPRLQKNQCSGVSLRRKGKRFCACSETMASCISYGRSINLENKSSQNRNSTYRGEIGKRNKRTPSSAYASVTDASCGGQPVGATWTDGCNDCVCSNAHVAMCTAKFCYLEYVKY